MDNRIISNPLEYPAPAIYPPPTFEAFALALKEGSTLREARKLVAEVLGSGWQLKPFGDDNCHFEIVKKSGTLPVGRAWEKTYLLRKQKDVIYAEPLFKAAVSSRGDWTDNSTVNGRAINGDGLVISAEVANLGAILCGDTFNLPASTQDPEWSIKQIKVIEAWNRFFAGNPDRAGAGIVIGHPDTGYTTHPEIANNLLADLGFDFVDDDTDAKDTLVNTGFIPTPGHGTATASVILSPRGLPGSSTPAAGLVGISGVAPGARLIPYRVGTSVVLLSTLNLARAIEQATRDGVEVISISMGGLWSWRLHEAVRFAQKRGVIVLAAAGNCVRFVVWPAAYSEVIAVAACNVDKQPWHGSSRGSAVDVTAPGESVWHADAINQQTRQSSGTSFAVATVAGLAVMWLTRHGLNNLTNTYGAAMIPVLFKEAVQASCDPFSGPGWTQGEFGAGLVNAEKLLDWNLPASSSVSRVSVAQGLQVAPTPQLATGGTPIFTQLFERQLLTAPNQPNILGSTSKDETLNLALAELLRCDPGEVPGRLNEVGQELAFHLAVNPQIYKAFARAITARQVAVGGMVESSGVKAANSGLDVLATAGAGSINQTRGELMTVGVSSTLGDILSPV